MLLTEEEAKTKFCPGKAAPADDAGIHYCEASDCMAWRWGDTPRETMRNYHDAPAVPATWNGAANVYPNGWQYHVTDTDQDGRKFDLLHRIAADDAQRHGFCGLAGKAVA